MNPRQAIEQLKALPEGEDIHILYPKRERKRRLERDGIISFRVPQSQKETLFALLDEIGARIGSMKRENELDWLIATARHELDSPNTEG